MPKWKGRGGGGGLWLTGALEGRNDLKFPMKYLQVGCRVPLLCVDEAWKLQQSQDSLFIQRHMLGREKQQKTTGDKKNALQASIS